MNVTVFLLLRQELSPHLPKDLRFVFAAHVLPKFVFRLKVEFAIFFRF